MQKFDELRHFVAEQSEQERQGSSSSQVGDRARGFLMIAGGILLLVPALGILFVWPSVPEDHWVRAFDEFLVVFFIPGPLLLWEGVQKAFRLSVFQRSRGRGSLAHRYQWIYVPEPTSEHIPHGILRLPFLRSEGAGDTSELVLGTWEGMPFIAFDYHSLSYAITQVRAKCPRLQLVKESAGDRMRHFFGIHDVELESKEFDRVWRIKTDDVDFARSLLGDEIQRWLLSPEALPFSFEVADSWLMCYAEQLSGMDIRSFVSALANFVRRIPRPFFTP